jgi:uncharacterized Tic20 family protein
MDNNIDNLGEPDESQQQPQPEDTPDVVEPEETPPTIELEDSPEEPSFTEPQEQPDMPDLPEGPSKDDRLWATFCHLAAFVGYIGVPFGQILGPLIIWLIKKEESPFIDANGKKALNFQISIMIYMLASIPLACGGPLILLAIVPLIIVNVIYTIIAAIKANDGQEVSYPISIGFIK